MIFTIVKSTNKKGAKMLGFSFKKKPAVLYKAQFYLSYHFKWLFFHFLSNKAFCPFTLILVHLYTQCYK